MVGQIEHFVYGSAVRLKRFRATIPDGIQVTAIRSGLVLRERIDSDRARDASIARIEALARAQGLDYDGHGEDGAVGAAGDAWEAGGGLDIETRTFTDRTGIRAGHGFALPLPDGRFGHGVYMGGDHQGHLLIDVSALVTNRPADCEAVRDAPRRYRQPILVWHTGFDALPLFCGAPIAQLPCEVVFRSSIGWPDLEDFAQLERRYGVGATDTPEGWNTLLTAMANAGERLPKLDSFCLTTARVGPTGVLKLIENHKVLHFADEASIPMGWQPSAMDEIVAILTGGQDCIAARDKVT